MAFKNDTSTFWQDYDENNVNGRNVKLLKRALPFYPAVSFLRIYSSVLGIHRSNLRHRNSNARHLGNNQ